MMSPRPSVPISVCIAAIGLAVSSRVDRTTNAAGSGEVQFDDDAIVYVDRLTGCEYLGYMNHGLTPRMEIKGGNYRHKGCRE